ncbi:60S ribosomal protein L23, putative [Ricinus communis]|uniref:60S ribosomal protein L23, putative n=1 Tax=Ricinus communis TaxID=3988 RepID=B9SGC4_RICCO|nr:60S ribosomal protein L23, putative [Ricinus communis]
MEPIKDVEARKGRINRIKGRLNRLPSTCVATVKKGKLNLRKKFMLAVIVCQHKPWHRKDGV